MERYRPDYGADAIKDCPKFGNWHDPCRAYYRGLTEWWEKQPREAGLGEPDRKQPGDVAAAGVCSPYLWKQCQE